MSSLPLIKMMSRVLLVCGLFLLAQFTNATTVNTVEQHRSEKASSKSRFLEARREGRIGRTLRSRVGFRSDAAGTETVLLVRGGVGVDVEFRQKDQVNADLFSTKKPNHRVVKSSPLLTQSA